MKWYVEHVRYTNNKDEKIRTIEVGCDVIDFDTKEEALQEFNSIRHLDKLYGAILGYYDEYNEMHPEIEEHYYTKKED